MNVAKTEKKEIDLMVNLLSSLVLARLFLTICVPKNERSGRFAGGAYSPFLKKVDRFSEKTLPVSLREREGFAARLMEIDAEVKRIIGELQERGFKSPYLRTFVVARINPVRFHRAKKGETKPPMAMGAALTRMAASAKGFDVAKVRQGDLALVAAVASGDE